jgi:hypothetical protein
VSLRPCMLFWNLLRKESKFYTFIVYRVVRFLCVVNLRMVCRNVDLTSFMVLESMVGSFF